MEGLHIPKEIFRYLKRFEYPHLVICQKKKKKPNFKALFTRILLSRYRGILSI